MAILDGLIGCWSPSLGASGYRLQDRTKYGNHGTLTNMDAGTDWVASPIGGVLDFDGTNDYVSIGSPGVFGASASITVAGWAKLRVSGSQAIAGKYVSLSNGGWILYGDPAAGWYFDGRDGGYISSGASGAFSANEWYFVAGRKSGNVWSVSVNGVQKNSVTSGAGTSLMSTTNPMDIGRVLLDAVPSLYANGQIGEVAFWRRAVQNAELAELFRLGNGWIGRQLTGVNRRRRVVKVPGNRRRALMLLGVGS